MALRLFNAVHRNSNGGRILAGAFNVLSRQKHTLPDLPYDYNALEPVISAEIMKLHHTKHHQTYVNNLNIAEEKLAEAHSKGDINGIVALESAIKFNGGGHVNHSIFWQNLTPKGGQEPKGDLHEYLVKNFGTVEKFKELMSTKTVAIQGSGWGWLGYCKDTDRLAIRTCANQDPLEGTTGLKPLLGIDVWEHAYYLQYKNVRADYVKSIWRIINWEDVAERFRLAKLGGIVHPTAKK